MSLYKLTGVDDLNTIGRTKKHHETAQQRHERHKKDGGGVKQVVKVAATPARLAFEALLDVNFLKLADKLKLAVDKDPEMVKQFWAKMGGKFDKLGKSIENGKKHSMSGIGVVTAAAVTAAVATATPIIIAATEVLKKLNIGSKADHKQLDDLTQKGANDLANDPNNSKAYVDMPTDSKVSPLKKQTKLDTQDKTNSNLPSKTATDTTTDTKDKTMLYLALGAGGLLLAKQAKLF